ncbi:hypothetical protein CDIK_4243, partial [Cucumispora dikerogammari]
IEMENVQIEMENVQIEMENVQIEMENVQIEMENVQIEMESVQIEMESVQIEVEMVYNVVCDPLVNKDCRVESVETTRTNDFREILGISKDKINTVEFKIRIICKVYCLVQKQDVITTFETKRFRFGENEEDKMVLKKSKRS